VPRPRLIERLDEGLRLERKLTLVSAPAGFGKTTLITEWACNTTREVAWVSLDSGDNDPIRFLTYIIAALRQVDGGIGRTVQDLLQSPQPPPMQNLVMLLINDIAASPTPFILILDDYHTVPFEEVHQITDFILTHQPLSMHLTISTRESVSLPSLSRLRVRDQVTEIKERDLRFTKEEAAAFLNLTMGLRLSPAAITILENRTEGWVAGLQLAALALQEREEDTERLVAAFTGDAQYVVDYLLAEVMERQPETTRSFLRQTAILDRLTPPLCDAVTGRENSQEMLARLEEANVFLTPIDQKREWYRYHPLFAQFLRARIDPEEQKKLHQRAVRWYENYGLLNPAIDHALALAELSAHFDDAERLICLAAEESILNGNVMTVRGWLDGLPEERVRSSGELATFKTAVLTLSGEGRLATTYADIAEARLRQTDAPTEGLGKLLVLRSFSTLLIDQDYEQASELAAQALQMLAEDQPHWRIIALWAMAESQERTGDITAAISTLREARQVGRASSSQLFPAALEYFLASALHLHGKRREAIAVCTEALEQYTDVEGHISPLAGLILVQLGVLHYEANQLKDARECFTQGQHLNEQLAWGDYFPVSYGFPALTLHALGETEAALEALRQAQQVTVQTGFGDTSWAPALETNIRLQQGDLAFALRWAQTAGFSLDDTPEYIRMESHLTYARLLLAQRQLSDARRWLARLENFTRERSLHRWLLTTHILQALTTERSGDHAAALERTTRAVRFAAPEEYRRAFLDEDAQIANLLAQTRHVAPAFIEQLLAAFPGVIPDQRVVAEPASSPLIDPLSERETEVLRLMAAGLSSPEIAEELVIAVSTVRSHIKSIYSKLDVHSRYEAVERATVLQLI
jgi:LuxR family maltose regulon positive regulatory protein